LSLLDKFWRLRVDQEGLCVMVLSGRHGDVNGTVSSGGSRGLFWWKDVQSTFK